MSFDKFTDKARKVLVIAQDEARTLHQPYVGTEHILLALIKEKDGLAAQALERLNVHYDDVVTAIKQIVTIDPDADVSGHLGFTPRVKLVLENSLREAMQMGQSYISTEHLLLGIVREGEGTAIEVLGRLGVSGDAVRSALNDLVGQSSVFAGRPGVDAQAQKSGGALKEYGTDLTKKAADGKLDPVIGRAGEIERIMQILCRRQKNNPLLIGEPGVGKTAVAEGLAQLIVSNQVPDILRNKRLFTLDISSLVAGSKYRGEFEDRLVSALLKSSTRAISSCSSTNSTPIGAGAAEGSIDAASILKPPLSRGEIQVIGATTIDEYRRHIEKDSALERRFQPVMVGEPNEEQSVRILQGLRERYESHHHVKYTDEALQEAVALSSRYIQDRFLPDKAIDVIDEAGARQRIRNMTLPPELSALDDELRDVRGQKEAAIADQNFEEAAAPARQGRAAQGQARPGRSRLEGKLPEGGAEGHRRRHRRRRVDDLGRARLRPHRSRSEQAAAHGKRAPSTRDRPGRSGHRRVEGHPPFAQRPFRPQASHRLVHLLRPFGRGQDRTGQSARRVPLQQRGRSDQLRHERVHGKAHGLAPYRFASGLRGLRRGRPAHQGGAPAPLLGRALR